MDSELGGILKKSIVLASEILFITVVKEIKYVRLKKKKLAITFTPCALIKYR